MASGYTRQAAANIGVGLPIQSADFNAEFDQIQTAFDGSSGHTHTGGSGLGAKIPLTTSVSGTLPLGNGGTGATSFTAGSVLFSNGTVVAQDNTNLFWDNTNNFLGIGITVPTSRLHLHQSTAATGLALHLTSSETGSTSTDGLIVQVDATGNGYLWHYDNFSLLIGTNNTQRMLVNAGGNVSIGNSNNTYKLDVTGDMNISGTYRISGTALAATNLANGTTGTGAVMLAASPFTTGTLTAQGISASSVLTSGAIIAGTTLAVGTNASVTGALTLGTDLAITEGGTGASTAANAFANIAVLASSLATPGYIKFQNGLILQWGATAVVAANAQAIVFPIPFPTTLFAVVPTFQMAPGATQDIGVSNESVGGFNANFSTAYTGQVYWVAVGV